MLLTTAQRKVLRIWLVGSGLLFVILFLQMMFHKYGNEYLKVSGWYTQNILPTLGILISSFIYVNRNRSEFSTKKVSLFYFSITKYSSLCYFFSLFLTIFLQPTIYSLTSQNALEVLSNSTFFLSIFQTTNTSLLGLLFIKSE